MRGRGKKRGTVEVEGRRGEINAVRGKGKREEGLEG